MEQFYLESLMALQKHGITAQALCLHSTMEQICPPQIRTAFQGWTAERVTFGEGTCLYRIHSGRPYGSWWMLEPPAGELQFRIDYAVRPEWNAATEMAILTVPRGESLSGWIGRAAYQGGIYIGGGVQVYLLKVPKGWVSSGPVPW